MSWSVGQVVGRAWPLWADWLHLCSITSSASIPRECYCAIFLSLHDSQNLLQFTQVVPWCTGVYARFLRHCMMAVPKGSKPAEAVLGECYSAQGAILSLLSVGNSPCSKSCSKIHLLLCQKNLPVSPWKEGQELRDVWRTIAKSQIWNKQGSKVIKILVHMGLF